MLLSAGLPLPHKALVAEYGPDAVRLYFMKDIVFGQDGDFAAARFRDSVNAALANNLGNMLNRTLNLLHKYCQGQ
ncbi:uncharacterized protein HaLaN_31919, partial [Haematococcus lacustris]